MADRLASGELEPILRVLRDDEGRSWDFICRRLYVDYGIEVTSKTLVSWCEQLGIGERAGAA